MVLKSTGNEPKLEVWNILLEVENMFSAFSENLNKYSNYKVSAGIVKVIMFLPRVRFFLDWSVFFLYNTQGSHVQ